jgi:hypothetical protein
VNNVHSRRKALLLLPAHLARNYEMRKASRDERVSGFLGWLVEGKRNYLHQKDLEETERERQPEAGRWMDRVTRRWMEERQT